MQSLIFEIIICILAGIGAGVSTGFAGLSAACYISPMLVAFLDVPVYYAVGISLASDVLASAVSAWTYHKEGNLNVKKSLPLMASVLTFAIVGSIVAYFISSTELGNTTLGYYSILGSLALGLSFLFKKEKEQKETRLPCSTWVVIAFGMVIGFICGFQGAGGGMMMLMVLTIVMRYDFKPAVGTSVFIMAFCAFISAATHFYRGGMPDTLPLILCIVSTTVSARWAAGAANKMTQKALRRIIGVLLTVSAVAMLLAKIFL